MNPSRQQDKARVLRAVQLCADMQNGIRTELQYLLHAVSARDVRKECKSRSMLNFVRSGRVNSARRVTCARSNRRGTDVIKPSCKTHPQIWNCLHGPDMPVATVLVRKSFGARCKAQERIIVC